MARLTLALLLGALLVNPDLRDRARPYALRALDPAYEWLVQSRVGEIARAIDAQRSVGRPTPTSAGLPAFLSAYYERQAAALDPWGHPYFLTRDDRSVRVSSAGRDGIPRTPDDILSSPLRPAGP